MNKVDFLLHGDRFHARLATRASAFPSTGRHRGTRGVLGEVNRRIQVAADHGAAVAAQRIDAEDHFGMMLIASRTGALIINPATA